VGTWTGWVQKTAEVAALVKRPAVEERQKTHDEKPLLSPAVLNDPLYSFTIPGVREGEILEFSANDPTLMNLDTLTPMYDLRVFGRYAGYIALTLNKGRRMLSYSINLRPHAQYLKSHVERWLNQQVQCGEAFITSIEQVAKSNRHKPF